MTIGLGEATAAAVRARIGVDALRKAKLGPEYSYPSLPLCVIDAVFSIGVRYVNARRAVTAWCEAQHSQWSEDRADGVPARRMRELVRPLAGLSGAERAEDSSAAIVSAHHPNPAFSKPMPSHTSPRRWSRSGLKTFRTCRNPAASREHGR